MTVSFSELLRYASDTNNAGPEIPDSTSRENVTEGRAGDAADSSTYRGGGGDERNARGRETLVKGGIMEALGTEHDKSVN